MKAKFQLHIDQVRNFCFHLPFYHHTLTPPEKAKITITPHDAWPGNAEIGHLLLEDIFKFEGHQHDLEAPNWWPDQAPQSWLNYAHSFHWLRDLRETSGETARRKARDLISNWIDLNQKYNAFIWSADRVAKRIYSLIALYDFYAATADDAFVQKITDYIFKQILHLKRLNLKSYNGNRYITILRGLLFGLFNMPLMKKEITFYEKELLMALPEILNHESCHKSRNPTNHIELIRLLIDIKTLYQTANHQVPAALNQTIKMMSPLVKFFTNGDHRLFLFHGSWEQRPILIETLQDQLDPRLKPLKSYYESGYEKLTAGKTALLIDTAAPPEAPYDRWAHASTFAFELVNGRQKIITNCGHPQDNHENWDRLLATTAAHSTLVVENANSSEVLDKGIGEKPGDIQVLRQEDDKSATLKLSHNGYMQKHSITHHREITLSKNGYLLMGEDCLKGPGGKHFAVRFHLHPKVKASLIQDGKAVLLSPPSGPGWRMDCEGVEIAIEQSVYYGNGKSIIPTTQICLNGETRSSSHHKTIIKWQFQTVPR